MKKTILFEDYNYPCYIAIEKIGKEVTLYKRNGVLNQLPHAILSSLAEEGKINCEEIGETLQGNTLYRIDDKVYRVKEGWIYNNEAELTLIEFKGKYKYNYNCYNDERVKSYL